MFSQLYTTVLDKGFLSCAAHGFHMGIVITTGAILILFRVRKLMLKYLAISCS